MHDGINERQIGVKCAGNLRSTSGTDVSFRPLRSVGRNVRFRRGIKLQEATQDVMQAPGESIQLLTGLRRFKDSADSRHNVLKIWSASICSLQSTSMYVGPTSMHRESGPSLGAGSFQTRRTTLHRHTERRRHLTPAYKRAGEILTRYPAKPVGLRHGLAVGHAGHPATIPPHIPAQRGGIGRHYHFLSGLASRSTRFQRIFPSNRLFSSSNEAMMNIGEPTT